MEGPRFAPSVAEPAQSPAAAQGDAASFVDAVVADPVLVLRGPSAQDGWGHFPSSSYTFCQHEIGSQPIAGRRPIASRSLPRQCATLTPVACRKDRCVSVSGTASSWVAPHYSAGRFLLCDLCRRHERLKQSWDYSTAGITPPSGIVSTEVSMQRFSGYGAVDPGLVLR